MANFLTANGKLVKTPLKSFIMTGPQSKHPGFVTFWSPNAFITGCFDARTVTPIKGWDGSMEYSTDKSSWTPWSGNEILSAVKSRDNNYYLYVRGTGNTYVTNQDSASNTVWPLYKPDYSGFTSDVHVTGNFETLLDYRAVLAGEHPAMAERAFQGMFSDDPAIVEAPFLGSIILTPHCYHDLFCRSTSLAIVPQLPATQLAYECYRFMFFGCQSLYVSDVKTDNTPYEWRIPSTGEFTGVAYGQYDVFSGCPGNRSSNDINGALGTSYTYYTQNPPVA